MTTDVFRTDAAQYLLLFAALLREVEQMRAEVMSWPAEEQQAARRLARQLQDLDARIRELLEVVVSNPGH